MMQRRIEAFRHAFRGGWTLLTSQPHAKVHAVATVVVIVAGYVFRVSTFDWALLVLAISIVWLAEAVNTAIEFLADEVTLERRERIKHSKDVAAFAVLSAALGAATIGILVFLPYLVVLL